MMSRWASFAIGFLLALFPLFCFGKQPAPGSEAAMSGLRGPVQSVLTEIFIYRDSAERTPVMSERSIYDHTGYETELYKYDSRGVLRSHTVYTRDGTHLVKTETINPSSKDKSVQKFDSNSAVTESDTYDSNGVPTAQSSNNASAKTERSSVSRARSADGSASTFERFGDGSFKESTAKADGTTIAHFHSPNVDWRQVTDSYNRSLDYVEEPSGGKYLRISSRYDKAGRETENATYDRSGKLQGETTFQYPHEDKNGNWTEQQIWAETGSKAAQLLQVTHRTITYYRNPDNGER
jgi:hypothetical protein